MLHSTSMRSFVFSPISPSLSLFYTHAIPHSLIPATVTFIILNKISLVLTSVSKISPTICFCLLPLQLLQHLIHSGRQDDQYSRSLSSLFFYFLFCCCYCIFILIKSCNLLYKKKYKKKSRIVLLALPEHCQLLKLTLIFLSF